jgi:hypothetical protein
LNGAVFGLWHSGERSALEAMSAKLSHCGEPQYLYELSASLYVGVCGPSSRTGGRQVPAVCVGPISNVPYLRHRFALPVSSEAGHEDELIWQLYCHAGMQGLEHVDGAFQAALYDEDLGKLILITGRDGRLPICVGRLPSGWAFAPELKALQVISSFHGELGRSALAAQLDNGERILRKPPVVTVRYVWPGQIGTFEEAGDRIAQMTALEPASPARTSTDVLADLRRTIISTARRMTSSSQATAVAITPGLGSLICLGAARWVLREEPVRTYAVVYGDRDPFADFAQRVARYFCTDHEDIILSPGTARSLLGELVWETEHPLASERMLDHLLIAREAVGRVDLLLNGDICFGSECRTHRLRLGWPGARSVTSVRQSSAEDLTPTAANLHDLASFDRLHARAGVSTEALFHDPEVRASCVLAAPAVQGVYSASKKAACALGAGFVPAHLFEEARHHAGHSNDAFWRQMKTACEDLLANDPLAVRGMPRVGIRPSSVAACRCLPAPLWSRVMLEMWCRTFVDGSARAEREAVISQNLAPGTAANAGSQVGSAA